MRPVGQPAAVAPLSFYSPGARHAALYLTPRRVAPLSPVLPAGAAMGTGSAMAHRAVDSVMGPRTVVHEGAPAQEAAAPAQMGPCGAQMKAFNQVSASSPAGLSPPRGLTNLPRLFSAWRRPTATSPAASWSWTRCKAASAAASRRE